MKKLMILLMFLIVPILSFGQRTYEADTITIPTGADTTISERFFSYGAWSIQFNYSELDGVDTLHIMSSASVDSTLYDYLWIDDNLDGTNDNPFTLADSSLTIWGESYPFIWIVYKIVKGTSAAGKEIYYIKTKQ